ncbi:MAG: BlaI/MecI/CopY family transcriptional regulator [Clostridia bacterium]|nr:BlaI/MecI/CopY family transcriptional regulator [Clostridia bacterium]
MQQVARRVSASELTVLEVLWREARPLSVAELHGLLAGRGWELSTVKTLLRRLCEKGAAAAEKRDVLRYTPLLSERDYRTHATETLVERVFHGSARALVASLVREQRLSREDLAELMDVLQEEEERDV